MIRIGIIGANGQVGTEACLYLSQWPGIEPVAFCRSRLGAVVLKTCGVESRIISFADSTSETIKGVVGDLEVIVDFSAPVSGNLAAIKRFYRSKLNSLIPSLCPGQKFIFMSSMMAYGMNNDYPHLKYYVIPRTIYAASKRYAENTVIKLCGRHEIDSYVLRLGQVHGALQGISRALEKLNDRIQINKILVPSTKSYAVFCYTVAEAIANIALGKESPGTYTLLSSPEWTWKEVYEFYIRGSATRIIEVGCGGDRSLMLDRMRSRVIGRILREKDVIRANTPDFLAHFDDVIKTQYHIRMAKQQIAEYESSFTHQVSPFKGEVPGARLTSLSDCRDTIMSRQQVILDLISSARQRALANFRKRPSLSKINGLAN